MIIAVVWGLEEGPPWKVVKMVRLKYLKVLYYSFHRRTLKLSNHCMSRNAAFVDLGASVKSHVLGSVWFPLKGPWNDNSNLLRIDIPKTKIDFEPHWGFVSYPKKVPKWTANEWNVHNRHVNPKLYIWLYDTSFLVRIRIFLTWFIETFGLKHNNNNINSN